MENTVLQRVNEIVKKYYSSEREFAIKIGSSPKTINQQLKGDRSISLDTIINILSSNEDISPNWLLKGIGNINDKPIISYSSGRPYYNVDFLGGFDLSAPDNTVNPDYNIDYEPYNKDGVMWCNITGESMEPKINSGDKIAIAEVLEWNQCIVCGEIYAIITKNNLRTVKIISKDNGDEFILKAINKEFHPQPIKKNMITKVFKVMGCIKAF